MFTAVMILFCVRYKSDRHIWDVPITDFEGSALMSWLAEFSYLLSTCSTKVSVLLFYRRLVKGTFSKRWKWATIAAIAFTVCYGLTFILLLIFNCRPTEAYWKSLSLTWKKNYTCADTRLGNPVSGAMSVLSDFYSVILPMAMLRHFETDRRKKIALNAIFLLGLLVVAAGAVRTYFLEKLGTDPDITWTGSELFIWADLEMQLSIMLASAPALRVLFRQYLRDPMSRAAQTVSSTSRSANQSENRNSRPPDSLTSGGTAFTRARDSATFDGSGDTKQSAKLSLDRVEEQELEYSPSTAQSEPYWIRTPEDFEAYALQNLEKNRPPPRRSMRASSNRDMRPMPAGPLTDWQTPDSWLNIDDKD